jgi:hypothetical protein
MPIEKVYTVEDYYDRPINGVSSYLGKPHIFKLIFDISKDEYSKIYELQEISQMEFELRMKSWSLWLKWNDKKDKTPEEFESHPVLPDDQKEFKQIEERLNILLDKNKYNKFWLEGEFIRTGAEHHDFDVEWKINS